MDETIYTNDDRRQSGERRQMDSRRESEGRREDDVCPLQNLHIEKLSNLEARMDMEESRSKVIEFKLEVVTNIDKNLEVITELFKLQKEVNMKQEKTNEKLEESISKVASAVTQSKLDGSISFNQILSRAFYILLGGGVIYVIYQIANGVMK